MCELGNIKPGRWGHCTTRNRQSSQRYLRQRTSLLITCIVQCNARRRSSLAMRRDGRRARCATPNKVWNCPLGDVFLFGKGGYEADRSKAFLLHRVLGWRWQQKGDMHDRRCTSTDKYPAYNTRMDNIGIYLSVSNPNGALENRDYKVRNKSKRFVLVDYPKRNSISLAREDLHSPCILTAVLRSQVLPGDTSPPPGSSCILPTEPSPGQDL